MCRSKVMVWVNQEKATIGQSTPNRITNSKRREVYGDATEEVSVDVNKQNHIHNHFIIKCTAVITPQTEPMIEVTSP